MSSSRMPTESKNQDLIESLARRYPVNRNTNSPLMMQPELDDNSTLIPTDRYNFTKRIKVSEFMEQMLDLCDISTLISKTKPKTKPTKVTIKLTN